jgi:hypothetical protein
VVSVAVRGPGTVSLAVNSIALTSIALTGGGRLNGGGRGRNQRNAGSGRHGIRRGDSRLIRRLGRSLRTCRDLRGCGRLRGCRPLRGRKSVRNVRGIVPGLVGLFGHEVPGIPRQGLLPRTDFLARQRPSGAPEVPAGGVVIVDRAHCSLPSSEDCMSFPVTSCPPLSAAASPVSPGWASARTRLPTSVPLAFCISMACCRIPAAAT